MEQERRPAKASPVRVGALLGLVVGVAVAVFSLGVWVGERVAATVPAAGPPPAALPTENIVPVPVSPPPPPAPVGSAVTAPQKPIAPESLTFYDRLSGKVPPGPIDIPQGQAPPQAPPAPAAAAAPEQPAAPAAPAPKPAPAVKTTGTVAVASPRLVAAVPPPAPRVAPPPPAPADPVARIRKLSGRGAYQVQFAATQQPEAANDLATKFSRQGFEVIKTMVVVKGKTWYRVRVGSFPDRDAAARAAEIFKSALGMPGMVVRE
jgi:septal ring-binding cell division protein DamX